jgi:hypothetical protein
MATPSYGLSDQASDQAQANAADHANGGDPSPNGNATNNPHNEAGDEAPAAEEAPAPAASESSSNSAAAQSDTAAPAAESQATTAAATSEPGNKNAGCHQTPYGDTGPGANHNGPYDDTCDGSASGNGNGGGQAVGKPCAGCVGKADEKNPHGQYPGPQDHNNGYECDGNHGIARTNPAHTGCKTPPPPPCVPTEQQPCNPCVPSDTNPCENPGCVDTPTNPCNPSNPQCVDSAAVNCSAVLGRELTRTTGSPSTSGTSVLGEVFERSGTLAFTGFDTGLSALLGGLLVLLGWAMTVVSRRRRPGRSTV